MERAYSSLLKGTRRYVIRPLLVGVSLGLGAKLGEKLGVEIAGPLLEKIQSALEEARAQALVTAAMNIQDSG